MRGKTTTLNITRQTDDQIDRTDEIKQQEREKLREREKERENIRRKLGEL